MTTSRFDPRPDEQYGHCSDCPTPLPTRQDGIAHMDATMTQPANGDTGKASHSIRIKNATREERLRRFFQELDDESVDDAVDEIVNAVYKGDITEQEAIDGSRPYDRFHEEIVEEYDA